MYKDLIELANGEFAVSGWDIQVVNLEVTKYNWFDEKWYYAEGPGTDAQSQLVGVRTSVPEPATLVLLGAGLLGLAGLSRKQFKK